MFRTLFVLIISVHISNAIACDVCGCSLSPFALGINQNFDSHYLGLRYSLARFKTEIKHTSSANDFEFSNDTYHRSEFVFRFRQSEKWRWFASFPIVHNVMKGSHQNLTLTGIGDPSLMSQFKLAGNLFKELKYTVLFAGGIKLPLGAYDLENDGVLINRNFQPGTGSFDFQGNLQFFVQRSVYGLVIESGYKLNTTNRLHYRFGNQFNSSVSALVSFPLPHGILVNMIGGRFEYSGGHTENGSRVLNTGGSLLIGEAGAQWYVKRIRLGANLHVPLIQNFRTDNLTTIKAGLGFNFDVIFFVD